MFCESIFHDKVVVVGDLIRIGVKTIRVRCSVCEAEDLIPVACLDDCRSIEQVWNLTPCQFCGKGPMALVTFQAY